MFQSSKKHLFSLSAFFLSLSILSAQEINFENQRLDSIIIQNQRLQIPFSQQNRDIQVIDKTQIKSMPIQSTADLLSYISGIDIRRRGVMGTQTDVSIQGGTFDQTLVLLNGMKIIDAQTGHNMMNLPISPDAIERIEILKGPAASAYGANAINGAINIITKQVDKTEGNLQVNSGSSFKKNERNHYFSGIDIGGDFSLKTEKSGHFLSANTIHSNGYRYNTAIENSKIFYTGHFNLGKHSLKMMTGYVTNDFGTNGFYSAPQDKDSKEKVQTTLADVQASLRITDFWTLRPRLSFRYNEDYYVLNQNNPALYENQHYNHSLEAGLNNSILTKYGNIGVGAEFQKNEITSRSLGKHSRDNIGFFGNYQLDLIPKTLINFGLYSNYNEDFGWDWMPSIDAGYEVSQNLRIFANAGSGLRLPTFTDLYYTGPVNIGNELLKPEKSNQIAAGLKFNKNRFRSSVELFLRETKDMIDWIKAEEEDPWTTLNFQQVETRGISLNLTYDFMPKNRTADFGLTGNLSYTYLDAEIKKKQEDTYISRYALENLKHQLNTQVNFDFFGKAKLQVNGKYQERISAKDYFLMDIRLSTEIDSFYIYLDAENLTDVTYTETAAVPMPGRWFRIGVKWNFL